MSQRLPDDPARYFREVWVGAPGVGVWPVAARFKMWGLAFGLWPICFVALALLVPALVIPTLVAIAGARFVLRRDSSMRVLARVGAGAMLGFVLLTKPSVSFWLLPMHWALAVFVAPVLAVFITSRIAPYVDLNVPLSYRIGLLFKVASRPRRLRPEAEITVADHILVIGDNVNLDDFSSTKEI